MKVPCILVKKTYLETLIESSDKVAINKMISIKEMALKEASENADFWASINDEEKADIESSRAREKPRWGEKGGAAVSEKEGLEAQNAS